MGRPINKKAFGLATAGSKHISVTGVMFADGSTATGAYIVKQTGSTAYMVQDAAKSHAPEIVFMVNADDVTALLPGQCFILGTPFGGSSLPCEKISQFRVNLYNVANGTPLKTGTPTPGGITSYTWGSTPATAAGQADILQF